MNRKVFLSLFLSVLEIIISKSWILGGWHVKSIYEGLITRGNNVEELALLSLEVLPLSYDLASLEIALNVIVCSVHASDVFEFFRTFWLCKNCSL